MPSDYRHPSYGPKSGLKDGVTPTDLAWFAGFVDGEGCLVIYPNISNRGNSFLARLLVQNTDLLPLKTIQSFYKDEANIGIYTGINSKRPHQKDLYRISIPQRILLETLSALVPYLKNKQEQAWIAMNYLITRFSNQHELDDKVFHDYADDIKFAKTLVVT